MKKRLLFLLSCFIILSGCMQKNDEMQAQLMQHDAQLRQMQPVQADAYNQVQAMREELNELRGMIVDIRNAGGAKLMVEKLNRHEQALRQIETSMAMNFNLGAPSAQIQDPPNPTQGAGEEQPAAAFAPQAAAMSEVPTGDTWGKETPQQAPAPEEKKDLETALFEAGVNSFKDRKYADAQRSFNDFISNFGSHAKAPTAQYYIAECYFQKNQYSDAALAYDTVITKYPKSAKAPASYLKQGICFSKMQQSAAAKARMKELIRKYPSSPEAKRANDFLKRNK